VVLPAAAPPVVLFQQPSQAANHAVQEPPIVLIAAPSLQRQGRLG
jgi:hypothetical protein